jgi:hypothetical protein
VYQHNAATLFKGEHTIFELTHLLEAASCRPYCLNDWRV